MRRTLFEVMKSSVMLKRDAFQPAGHANAQYDFFLKAKFAD